MRGLLLLLFFAPLMVGCGFFKKLTEDDSYKRARMEPVLEIPEELDPVAMVEKYPIPGGAPAEAIRETEDIVPSPLNNPLSEDIRIQKLGERSWLLVNLSTAEVWPRVRGFINLNRFPINVANVSRGIVETGWLQPENKDQPREKYRLWVEAGLRENTAEIYALHAGESAGDGWPETSHNPERALNLLVNFSNYLSDLGQAGTSVSLRALEAGGTAKMRLLLEDDTPKVVLDVDYDRAWATAALAVERAFFLITDRNRQNGVFYLAYNPKDLEKAKKKKRKKKNATPQKPSPEKLAKKLKNMRKFELHINRTKDGIAVTISGEGIGREEAALLLQHISAHIS